MLNLAGATGRLVRCCLQTSEFEFDLFHRACIKHQAAIALSRQQMTGADTDPHKKDSPVVAGDTDTTELSKVGIEKYRQPWAHVVEDKKYLTQGAVLTIADFLQHHSTNPYCRQTAQSVATTHAVYTTDKNGLIVWMVLVNGAV